VSDVMMTSNNTIVNLYLFKLWFLLNKKHFCKEKIDINDVNKLLILNEKLIKLKVWEKINKDKLTEDYFVSDFSSLSNVNIEILALKKKIQNNDTYTSAYGLNECRYNTWIWLCKFNDSLMQPNELVKNFLSWLKDFLKQFLNKQSDYTLTRFYDNLIFFIKEMMRISVLLTTFI
jgi:hypothetical protein